MTHAKARHIFISCGEASGDRYGASLASALRQQAPDLRISGLGGPRLAAAGAEIVQTADELGIMGLSEVLASLPAVLRARSRIWRWLTATRPDLVIPIDFPGFNLHLAGKAHRLQLPVYWLIAPQVWAWGGWRIPSLRTRISRLGTVLPFERDFFGQRGFSVFPMGHPLLEDYGDEAWFLDQLKQREERLGAARTALTIGVLPGSRRQEIRHLMPVLKVAAQAIKGHLAGSRIRFVVSAAPGLDPGQIAAGFGQEGEIVTDDLPRLLPRLDLALVCSGTASLEATLAGVPHELVYRTGRFNFWLAKKLVKTEFVGLSNLILDQPVIREHLQEQVAPLPLARSLLRWLARPAERSAFYEDARRIRRALGEPGVWRRTAADVLAHPALASGTGPQGG